MTVFIYEEDFADSGWKRETVLTAIVRFMQSFDVFLKRRGKANFRYLRSLFGSLIREEFMSRNRATDRSENPRTSAMTRKRRSRDKAPPAGFPAFGKTVTGRVHYRCELIYWLMFGRDSCSGTKFEKEKRMTQAKAVSLVSEWLYLLGLADPGTICDTKICSKRAIEEDKIKGISEGLARAYRNWAPGQLPGCSQGFSYSSAKSGGPIKLKSTRKKAVT